MVDMARDDPDDYNRGLEEMMKTNTELRWATNNGMYTFKASSPADWWVKASEYTMEGIADEIKCPTLVIDGEHEVNFTGEARKLYDALTCPKTWMLFTAEEGAEEHCQVGAALLAHQRIFDWLEETLLK
jgi:hypothetical protein